MKALSAIAAMIMLLGFVAFTRAAEDPPKPKVQTHRGTFVKVDGDTLTYKGTREPKVEHTIKVDDKTKVVLEGKEAKLTDLKPDLYLTIAYEGDTAVKITATATPPKSRSGPTTKPSST